MLPLPESCSSPRGVKRELSLCANPSGSYQTGQNSQPQFFENKVYIAPLAPASLPSNMGTTELGMKDGRNLNKNTTMLSYWNLQYFFLH